MMANVDCGTRREVLDEGDVLCGQVSFPFLVPLY